MKSKKLKSHKRRIRRGKGGARSMRRSVEPTMRINPLHSDELDKSVSEKTRSKPQYNKKTPRRLTNRSKTLRRMLGLNSPSKIYIGDYQ